MDLKGKKILFFSPKAFGYEVEIKNRLIELGSSVVYYDDRPSNGFWGKALLRVNKSLIKTQIDKYYKMIQENLVSGSPSFDYIFLLNLEAMPVWFIEWLKGHYKKSIVILYMWDSFRNKVNTGDYLPFCDRAITFDPEDLKTNPKLEFRPLFYLNTYADIAKNKAFDYDVSFVATGHSDRYVISNKVKSQIEKCGGVMYSYLYLQSKKLFAYLKITNSKFKKAKIGDFNYHSLSTGDLLNVISKSKAVLDVQHPMQTGLTMRTIEMIGAERKLITTNSAVKKYDFYNPNNISVIDRNDPIIDRNFLLIPYEPIPADLYHKYSLDGWLEYIFKL